MRPCLSLIFVTAVPVLFLSDHPESNKLGMAQATEKAVVLICHTKPQIENVLGTGFIIDPTGSVITADHVIFDEKARKLYDSLYAIYCTGRKHRYFRLRVLRRYRDGTKGRDLALLHPQSPSNSDLPYLEIGHTATIGDEVLIAGFPLIFDKVYLFPLVRRGTVASTKYSYEGHKVLILDLPSVDGFSGSPVVDLETRKVAGVLRGPPKGRHNTGFCVATALSKDDLVMADNE